MMPADSQPDQARIQELRKKAKGHFKGRELDLLLKIERLEAENKQMRDDLMKLAMDNRKWEKLYLEYKGNFAWIMKHFVDIKSFGSASLLFPSLFRGILQ